MKRFIVKIIVISLAVLIIFSVMNLVYINSDFFKTSMIDWTKFKDIPMGLDIVNTGSSHATKGINYSLLDGYNCRNLAAGGQTFEYDLKLLEQFSSNLEKGGLVIIPVSYLSFSKIDEGRDKKQSLRYYRILDREYINDFSISNYILYKVFPVLTSDKELVSAVKREFNADADSFKMSDYTEKELADALLKNKAAYFDIYEYDDRQLNRLCSLVEFALARDMRPILVTIPVSDVYTGICNDNIISDFYAGIDFVRDKYGVEYYDYGTDPDIVSNYELFKNTSHLSEDGSLLFSKKLFSDIGIYPGK